MIETIDLDEFRTPGIPVFTGRSRGETVRARCRLDAHDANAGLQEIRIVVPEDVFLVASSFLLGFLGPSIRALGEEGFRSRFTFHGPIEQAVIDDVVREALKFRSPLSRPVSGVDQSPV